MDSLEHSRIAERVRDQVGSIMDDLRNMIFAPNPSGRLHLGNAVTLWLTAKEAMARGCKLLIRIDYGYWPHKEEAAEQRGIDSVRTSLGILGIDNYWMIDTEERRGRYWGAMVRLGAELLNPLDGQCFISAGNTGVRDYIRGTVPTVMCYSWLRVPNEDIDGPYTHLCNAVDFHDYNVPLHIRGWSNQHMLYRPIEIALYRELWGPSTRPPDYATIPSIADSTGHVLSKSKGPPSEYDFEIWSKQFSSTEEIRTALERIVLRPGEPYHLANIRNEEILHVTPAGEVVAAIRTEHVSIEQPQWSTIKMPHPLSPTFMAQLTRTG